MAKTWIKMCGLKQIQEVNAAVELGVDAIGLVFYAPSSRSIDAVDIEQVLPNELQDTKVVALFNAALCSTIVTTIARLDRH